MRDERTSLDMGAAPAAVSLGRVSRSDERGTVQSVSDGRVASRVHLLPGSSRLSTHSQADTGFVLCHTCFGSPEQYLIDTGEDCDECNGAGSLPDPDYIDGDDFDPRSEFSTMPRLRGNGRGQL